MAYYLRSLSPPQVHNHREFHDPIAVDRFYNVEESQRKYEQLVQENIWLKDQIDRKRSGHPVEVHPQFYRESYRGAPFNIDHTKNDMILWGMIERNRYLQQKLAKLKKQQMKQASSIRKIECSEEWQTRHLCMNDKCYQHKYLQLLRVRSPFF